MMNWNSSGRITEFRYVRVSWPDFAEVGELPGVSGCVIDESMFTSIKMSGELEYTDLPDIGDDMVRVYSDSRLGQERATECHGTMFLSRPQEEVTEGIREGIGEMYSTLLVMRQSSCEETFTVMPGAVITEEVSKLIKVCSLPHTVTPSDATASTIHNYEAGTSYLEIANDLLEKASYASLDIDSYGNVIVAPYVDPADKAPAATISDTENSVGSKSFVREFDTFDVPNVIILVFSNSDNEPMVAVAENKDPENSYSTACRKKRICRVETVDEIASQKALNEKAEELLRASMTIVYSIEIEHSWLPFAIGDAVMFDYRRSDVVTKLSAANRSMRMTRDIACETRLRKFVNLLEVTIG